MEDLECVVESCWDKAWLVGKVKMMKRLTKDHSISSSHAHSEIFSRTLYSGYGSTAAKLAFQARKHVALGLNGRDTFSMACPNLRGSSNARSHVDDMLKRVTACQENCISNKFRGLLVVRVATLERG